MIQPGDRYAQAFTVEPGQCWAMVHDRQGTGDALLRAAIVDRAVVLAQRQRQLVAGVELP